MNAESVFTEMRKRNGPRAEMRLRHQMEFLYEGLDFNGRTVIDIGGGIGLHSFFAIGRGAVKAVVIEPEGDGGHSTMVSTFTSWRDTLACPNVELVRTTFQAYNTDAGKFDIVLIQDAINHFDEEACITLCKSSESWKKYDIIFSEISKLLNIGGKLVVADCSPRNLFPMLGAKNPFDLNIEWHKHQPPEIWADLARNHGLDVIDLRWSSPARFGRIGKVLFGNAVASWFFTSHFVMTLVRNK